MMVLEFLLGIPRRRALSVLLGLIALLMRDLALGLVQLRLVLCPRWWGSMYCCLCSWWCYWLLFLMWIVALWLVFQAGSLGFRMRPVPGGQPGRGGVDIFS
ncbi:hypothetical protein BA700_01090 [Corynebacterium stationis]|nr:hypothetical protein AW169_01090 [Corynebacterium stationis]AQX70105.1 hypothetical protein CA21670_00215 [Corynebacterium stationis]ASJ17809.1 hypothetical protein BA700_01090 [Corynebacterium stationis]